MLSDGKNTEAMSHTEIITTFERIYSSKPSCGSVGSTYSISFLSISKRSIKMTFLDGHDESNSKAGLAGKLSGLAIFSVQHLIMLGSP